MLLKTKATIFQLHITNLHQAAATSHPSWKGYEQDWTANDVTKTIILMYVFHLNVRTAQCWCSTDLWPQEGAILSTIVRWYQKDTMNCSSSIWPQGGSKNTWLNSGLFQIVANFVARDYKDYEYFLWRNKPKKYCSFIIDKIISR